MKTEIAVRDVVKTCRTIVMDSDGGFWRVSKSSRWGTMTACKPHRCERTSDKGYLSVGVTVNGKWLMARANRLVWLIVFGNIPNGKEVNHKNGDKRDNRPENLELTGRSGNMLHAFKTGLHNTSGERHPSAKLSDDQVKEIRRLHEDGLSKRAIAAKFSTSRANISKIVNRKGWNHV